MRGSPSATSTTLVRPDAPATRLTSYRRTPNAAATAASAASVALPSTARALTRTTSAPACSPPTAGRAEPGRTRIVIRTCLVCRTRRTLVGTNGRATVRRTYCSVVPNSEREPGARFMHSHAYFLTVRSTLSALVCSLFHCPAGNQIAESALETVRCELFRTPHISAVTVRSPFSSPVRA